MSQKPLIPENNSPQSGAKSGSFASLQKELAQTQALLQEAEKTADNARAEVRLQKQRRKDTQAQLRRTKRDLAETLQLLQDAKDETRYTQARMEQALGEKLQLSQQYESLLHSRTWRLTAPLRAAGLALRYIIGRCARAAFRLLNRFRRREHTRRRPYAPPKCKHPYRHEPCAIHSKDASRLGIYFIYDKDGIVDDYILFFLRALARCVKRLLIVSNGPLTADSRRKLSSITNEILIRDNKGFDSWAYKEAMQSVGYDELAKYDEVILTNFTIMGPVSPLETMFAAMDRKDVDFWGISAYPGLDFDPFHCCPYGQIPEHLQFYFVAFRSPMLQSESFRSYWDHLPAIKTYDEAVGLHEAVFTQYFADQGFVWDCYLDRDTYYPITDNPLICAPVYAMETLHCPMFKRRAFYQNYDYLISCTAGQTTAGLLRHLEQKTEYDTRMIWDNVLRTCHMSDLCETLHLTHVLPKAISRPAEIQAHPSVALVMHLYDTTMAEQLASYAQNLPDWADIYISTTENDKKVVIQKAFAKAGLSPDIRVQPNRGRDVSVLLAGVRDRLSAYDYICVTHDKKTDHLRPGTVGEGFAYIGYENILGSKAFVRNVLETFQNEPRLGLLSAPAPNHADFITHIGLEWGKNYAVTKALADELHIRVPMDEAHPPCAPIGSSFWARTKALAPLLQKAWIYDDFPAEPLREKDGTILHAVERIYPYAAQQAGYYASYLMTDDYYAVEQSNLEFYVQNYTKTLSDAHLGGRYVAEIDLLRSALAGVGSLRYCVRQKLKTTLFKWMAWADM